MAKGSVQVVAERSKDGSFCVGFCPTKVLALSPAFDVKGLSHPAWFTLKHVAAAIYVAGTAMSSQSRATRIPSRPSKP